MQCCAVCLCCLQFDFVALCIVYCSQTHCSWLSLKHVEVCMCTFSISLYLSSMCLASGVQVSYWTMVKERRITQTAAIILTQTVEEALEAAIKCEILDDWSGLNDYVQFPRYLKESWLRILPKNLSNFVLIECLEFGCCISAAFLRAHRIARRQLRDSMGMMEPCIHLK